MKIPLTGLLCSCLLLVAGTLPARAQEKKPDPQSVDQAAPQTAAGAAQDVPPQQAPADQQTQPPATPPPTTPQQTPPAGQTPTGQVPTPPQVSEPVRQNSRVPPAPPPPVKVPDVRRPGESGFWVGIEGWFPKEDATFDKGNKPNADYTDTSHVLFRGKPKMAQGIEAGIAVGLHNSLRISFFELRNAGDFTTPVDLIVAPQTYTASTYIATNFRLLHGKLSYDFLTWPFPVGSRKIRLKTLWQVQYTQVNSGFDSPYNYYNAAGNLILDTTGNPINLSASTIKHIISPMFGVELAYYPSRHVRLELSGSGFGFPHHYSIWEGEGSLSFRFVKHFELRAGGRAFGFKTSTNSDYFQHGTYAAAFVGFRWYSVSE